MTKKNCNSGDFEWHPGSDVNILGSLDLKHGENASLQNTPDLALSHTLATSSGDVFLLFIGNFQQEEIEVWKITTTSKVTASFKARIFVPGASLASKMSCDCAARDITTLTGDVTNFTLFVTCPENGSIRYIRLGCDLAWLENTKYFSMNHEVKSSKLYRPSAVTSYRNNDVTIAVVCGSSGSLFFFNFIETSESEGYVEELNQIGDFPLPNNCAIAMDSGANTYVISPQNDDVIIIKPAEQDFKTSKFVKGVQGLSVQETNTRHRVLGVCTNTDRVVALSGTNIDSTSTLNYGVRSPLFIKSILNMVIVSGRCSVTNCPKIVFFKQ